MARTSFSRLSSWGGTTEAIAATFSAIQSILAVDSLQESPSLSLSLALNSQGKCNHPKLSFSSKELKPNISNKNLKQQDRAQELVFAASDRSNPVTPAPNPFYFRSMCKPYKCAHWRIYTTSTQRQHRKEATKCSCPETLFTRRHPLARRSSRERSIDHAPPWCHGHARWSCLELHRHALGKRRQIEAKLGISSVRLSQNADEWGLHYSSIATLVEIIPFVTNRSIPEIRHRAEKPTHNLEIWISVDNISSEIESLLYFQYIIPIFVDFRK